MTKLVHQFVAGLSICSFYTSVIPVQLVATLGTKENRTSVLIQKRNRTRQIS